MAPLPNDGVNSVNGAINSSLSSLNSTVDKVLGGSASGQDGGPATSITGLGAVCKDYEENAMAAEKKWTGKRISITNATVLEVTKGRSASDIMTGMPKSTPNYYLLFKTADMSYCGGMVWIDYYSGLNDAVLTYKKGQKVSVTGTVNNFEVRGFATVNNADIPVRLVVLRNGTINH
ncbi:hypothetical protein BME90_23480 [Klebsiella quasipneumoniae subsp. similipneumoniae]|uniref:Uncharacterized protein n=1 Tax=Klebsiella pneumoniae TaxID=573 RepID=A0A6M5ZXF1_KLEPN|nr:MULTISPECIES: hypothetical protein [Klebsiella]OVT66314.1 hypothetical protein BME90_23480 [Klebsiella quasipneumoniae subsp. similipneumoniae]OVV10252.1 hypothetical protein BME89_23080 [Klebsiella quasipneumoniae subsp. similipneumoniae]PLC71501.1 hypothetical protein B6I39_15700 [Klebsiella quasipneumoniae]PLI53476.1 hypothetical protein B6J51_28230 [Klebsiella pneumoniae]QJX11262.1 hypothetical protein [Klebsiella pneumoniae]